MSGFTLTPVDGDPFASAQQPVQPPAAQSAASGYKLTPVDHDPFASGGGFAQGAVNVLRSINSGIPFTDRVIAGPESLPIIGNGQSYSDNLAREQSARAQLAQDHPIEMATGRGVGGLVSTLALPGAIPAEAGLGAAIGAGTKAGLAYGTAQGASDSPNLADVPQTLHDAGIGGLEGGAAGAAGSTLGYGLGKTGNALVDWVTGSPLPLSAEGQSLSAMADASASDANARRLSFDADMPRAPTDFGPQGMTLDSGPAMQALAQKVAATPEGAPIKTAVIDRANNVDRAISDALPGIIGPDQSALAAATALKADRLETGKALQPIFANAPQVDVSPVLQQIGQTMAKLPAGSAERAALQKSFNMLAPQIDVGGGQTMRIPVTDAQTLDNAKRAIDGLINFGDPTIGVAPGALASKNSSLKMAAGGINQALRDQVPGYGDTMDALSGLAKRVEGIEYGQSLLDTGKTAIHPSDSALKFGGMTPEELDAARAGVNSEIYRTAGAPANKTSLDALNTVLPSAQQTGDRWNAAKLNQVFAPEQVDALTALQNQGNQFREAAARIGGTPAATPRASVTPTDAGWIAYDAARGLHGIPLLTANTMNAVTRLAPGTSAKNSVLAEALTSRGVDKDSIAAAIGDLLARRAAAQNTGMTLAPVFAGAGLGAVDR